MPTFFCECSILNLFRLLKYVETFCALKRQIIMRTEVEWVKESIFHRLYDEYHQDVFQFLIYLVKNRTVAEDLSHEVYVRVLKAYERFEGKSSEKTWLFSIAKNVAIDYFRKKCTSASYI